ncbi:MAG: alkaline phosphatase family protein [Kofleriaceae bacterium]
MENEPSSAIYGNPTDAPYINGLLASAAHSTNFVDELPALVSEPHYVWMEAGTNAFTDRTFASDVAPSSTNSTTSTAHLVTQLEAAHVPWMSYQQGITSNTCPIAASGVYVPKHDPFVFFSDVSGSPPSASNQRCSAHHKSYSDFAHDLSVGIVGYVFITGDLCHDMHGDAQCPQGTAVAANIKAGDTWLSTELPRIIAYTQTHDALIFLTWDEGDASNQIPFLVIGQHVTAGGTSSVAYTHSSMLKSTEEFLGVPTLGSVTSANDFAALFQGGMFP